MYESPMGGWRCIESQKVYLSPRKDQQTMKVSIRWSSGRKDLKQEDSLGERKSPIWHPHQAPLMEGPTLLVQHPRLQPRPLHRLGTKRAIPLAKSTACELTQVHESFSKSTGKAKFPGFQYLGFYITALQVSLTCSVFSGPREAPEQGRALYPGVQGRGPHSSGAALVLRAHGAAVCEQESLPCCPPCWCCVYP